MKKQYLSVGFADLTHYSKVLQLVSPADGVKILQDCYSAVGDVITRHKGKIRKYIGDAVLFTFDTPEIAIQAAGEITSCFQCECENLKIRFNVGIATGDVLIGKIGHKSLRLEDILGETVNRAAILLNEARHKRSGVALCETTRKFIK